MVQNTSCSRAGFWSRKCWKRSNEEDGSSERSSGTGSGIMKWKPRFAKLASRLFYMRMIGTLGSTAVTSTKYRRCSLIILWDDLRGEMRVVVWDLLCQMSWLTVAEIQNMVRDNSGPWRWMNCFRSQTTPSPVEVAENGFLWWLITSDVGLTERQCHKYTLPWTAI